MQVKEWSVFSWIVQASLSQMGHQIRNRHPNFLLRIRGEHSQQPGRNRGIARRIGMRIEQAKRRGWRTTTTAYQTVGVHHGDPKMFKSLEGVVSDEEIDDVSLSGNEDDKECCPGLQYSVPEGWWRMSTEIVKVPDVHRNAGCTSQNADFPTTFFTLFLAR